MSTELTLVEKRCSRCGEVKPASEFHRQRTTKTGLHSRCKQCATEATQESIERRKNEMGEEAWRAYQKTVVKRSRERTGDVSNKLSMKAQWAALARLRERHRAEYEQFLREERYARGLEVRG